MVIQLQRLCGARAGAGRVEQRCPFVVLQGAATQTVLMSVYRTLRLRGLAPTKTIADRTAVWAT